jgi:hypothetical protein
MPIEGLKVLSYATDHIGNSQPVFSTGTYSSGSTMRGMVSNNIRYSGQFASSFNADMYDVAMNRLDSFFSSSTFGTVCTLPQYSHSAVLAPSTRAKSPPHILHLMIAMVGLLSGWLMLADL